MSDTVIGGEQAIAAAGRLLAEERRGDRNLPAIGVDQIREQMSLAVDRVMSEGSIYDPELARAGAEAGMGRHLGSDLPAQGLPDHAAALRRLAADRHGEDADPPPGLVDVQGSARRPGARRHLRLQPATPRFRTARPRRRRPTNAAEPAPRPAAAIRPFPRPSSFSAPRTWSSRSRPTMPVRSAT